MWVLRSEFKVLFLTWILFCCCDKASMTTATYKKQNLFGLTVPETSHPNGRDNMAGSRSRPQSAQILSLKHGELEMAGKL